MGFWGAGGSWPQGFQAAGAIISQKFKLNRVKRNQSLPVRTGGVLVLAKHAILDAGMAGGGGGGGGG